LVQSRRFFTAKVASALLRRTGAFWERGYFDRHICDDYHPAAVLNDKEQNLLKAGLVARAEDWPWSSSAQRRWV